MEEKDNIRLAIQRFIAEDPQAARFELRDGRPGVFFTDDQVFIPLADLGYNSELGFYALSLSPDVTPDTTNEPAWTLHPVIPVSRDDAWRPYAVLDPDGYGFLVGEAWQVAELAEALRLFLERGLMSHPIAEDAEELGTRWLTISEAMAEAHAFDPDEYPLNDNLAARIRQAARRGTIGGVVQDNTGRYKFQARRFRHWLVKNQQR